MVIMGVVLGRCKLRACVAIPVLLCTMLILPSAGTLIASPQAWPKIQPPGSGLGTTLAPGAGILGDPGSGWSPDVLVSWVSPSEVQRNASIAADRDGLVRVAYEDYDSTVYQYGICDASSPDGGLHWGATFCFARSSFVNYSHPSVAMNVSGGETLVVFESSGGGLLLAHDFLHGHACCQILTTDPGDHNPSIAISQDSSANAFLTFERDDGAGGSDLMFTAARDRGVWRAWETPQTLVGGFDHSINRMPRVAWGDPNNVYVVYERQTAPGNRDVLLMRSMNGGIPASWTADPGTNVVATTDDEFGGDVAAVSGSAKVVVPFARAEGPFDQVFIAYSEDQGNPGTWFFSPVTTGPSDHKNPRVAVVPAVGVVRIVYWSWWGVFASTAPVSSLSSWTWPVRVTDSAAMLTPEYDVPAIVAYPYGGEWYTGVVWTDYRNGLPNYDIYYTMNSPQLVFPYPDLAPTAIEILPRPPLSNNTATQVNVTIANLGNVSARDFDLLLFDDGDGDMMPDAGENVSVSHSAGLASYSQTNVSLSWDASPAGNHSLCAFADPPPSKVNESDETNNVACMEVEVLSPPDYVPTSPVPSSPVKTGLSLPLQLSIQVLNQGDGNASAPATVAFYNESSPAIPFAAFTVTQLNRSETSSPCAAVWTSTATPGTYLVSADVDYYDNVTEWDETNNVYTWTIEVVMGPITALVIGNPNYTSTLTYVNSSTPLSLIAEASPGAAIAYIEYRVDDGNWETYAAPFAVSREGAHMIEYRSSDTLGNLEASNWRPLVVDNTPPRSDLHVGTPSYTNGGTWVTSSTPLSISAEENATENATYTTVWRNLVVYNEPIGNSEPFDQYLSRVNLTVSREIWPGLSSATFSIDSYCFDVDLGVFIDTNGDGTRQPSELVGFGGGPTSYETVVVRNPAPGSYIIAVAGYDVPAGGCYVNVTVTQDFGGSGSSGLSSVRFRIWSQGVWTTWANYVTSFSIPNEGTAGVERECSDRLGNVATTNSTLRVDDSPPATTISPAIGEFNLTTTFTLTATDGGSGVKVTRYRIDGESPIDYSGGFTLSEGLHNISYYSKDNLDNTEQEKWLVVDVQGPPPPNTPPTVTLNSPIGGEEWLPGSSHTIDWTMHDDQDIDANLTVYVNYTTAGVTSSIVAGLRGIESFLWTLPDLEAANVVVNVTVIDTGGLKGWDQSGPLTIKAPPPPSVEANYKPLVALAFAIILAVVGLWSSRRRPWKGEKGMRGVMKAFIILSLPFILAEAVTGVVSFATGQLSIPPLFGSGTIVDLTILMAGLGVPLVRVLKTKPSEAGIPKEHDE